MRKIRDVLRLKFNDASHSNEKIAQIVGIGETTVREYLIRARAAGLTWPLPEELCDKKLEDCLYPPQVQGIVDEYYIPDFERIHNELKRKGVTLLLLWEEYKQSHSNPCCYSQFCQLYKEWCATGDSWMIQVHKAGEETFIDWAGLTMPIYNPKDGSVAFSAQIFVSSLGASSYTFCRAMKNQQIPEWSEAHKRMSEFYGGITGYWIPDNTRTAVTKSHRYEPNFQEAYAAMARHYHVAVVPARVCRPQDKSKAEGSVYMVETHILAPLRDYKFFSLEELNAAIEGPLKKLNDTPFKNMPGSSRYSLYLEIDKPVLTPLPAVPYESFFYGRQTLNKGYHILIEGVPYSIPHTLIGRSIEWRYNERTVEFFYNSKQIAIHQRSFHIGVPTTDPNHQPIKHRSHAESTDPENIRKEAAKMGESVLVWVNHVLADPDLKEKQSINTVLGVVRLSKTYSFARINAACARGVRYGNFLFKGIEDTLKRNLDSLPLPPTETPKPLPQKHINVRGPDYYL